jgi:signal transduction histidine kinase/ligand-binding sensor domain-containing protein
MARDTTGQKTSVLLCCWLLLCCVRLYGIDRDRALDQLYHTSWTYANGAPGDVHSLAQTTDGFLWLGTATGLYRFDGIRFQRYGQRNVFSLFADPGGGLWVGYWYGGVSFIKNGSATEYGKEDGLPSHAVLAFARDQHGAIWIAAGKDGLVRLEGSRWKKIGLDWEYSGPADTVFVDHAGTVWVGTPTTVEYLPEGGHRFRTAAEHLFFVQNFAEAPNGTLWMAETGHAVQPVPLPGKGNAKPGPAIVIGSQSITFDRQGSLWIASLGDGIRRVPYPERLPGSTIKKSDSEVESFTKQNGLTNDYIYCVLQDHEGNVWIGTSGGLDRLRQSPVVSVPSRASSSLTALAAGDEASLWVAGVGPQVLFKIQQDRIVTQLRNPKVEPDLNVDCAYHDPLGVVWLATPYSIFRLAPERLNTIWWRQGFDAYKYSHASSAGNGMVLRRLDLPPAGERPVSPQSRVKAITEDRVGRLWISTQSGTFRLEGPSWTSLESLGGPLGTASTEFTDSDGRIWFGFRNNTIAMLDGNKVRYFSGKDGVQVGAVTSIQGEGARIWIGGESGLEFFDGSRFHPIDPADGSSFGGISGVIANPRDGLWFAENRGIVHIPASQLRHLGSGKVEFESFGLLDGLTAQLRGPLASPSVAQTTDGRIWFATTQGLAWIDPKRIVRNEIPPPVSIESVVGNGHRYDNLTCLRLPPRTANLQIAYTATSFTVPERVRFRYKLVGQDKDWQDAGTRREAFYTNLDPGSYQFRVIACNNDGVWNETGALLHFEVRPAFYQMGAFKSLCGVALLALLWSLYRLRLRQATARIHHHLAARLEERERIARELHDTLLQSFQGLLLRFQAASNLLPSRPDDAKKKLDHAITQTSQAIIEGRGAVQGLRSSAVISNDLAEALRTLGDELSAGATGIEDPVFEVIVEGVPRTLHPVVRDEVYRIASEALRNAFHHAESNRIEVELHFDAIRLRLRVRDDGKGIEARLLGDGGQPGHWGVQGMRERADIIGGKLEIWSDVGAGTEIELTLPASVAYAEDDARYSLEFQERN